MNFKLKNGYKPKMDRVQDSNLWKIEWDLDGIPENTWREIFKELISKDVQIVQRNFISKVGYNKRDLSPVLNYQSITFYATEKEADNIKDIIQKVIDATNEQER